MSYVTQYFIVSSNYLHHINRNALIIAQMFTICWLYVFPTIFSVCVCMLVYNQISISVWTFSAGIYKTVFGNIIPMIMIIWWYWWWHDVVRLEIVFSTRKLVYCKKYIALEEVCWWYGFLNMSVNDVSVSVRVYIQDILHCHYIVIDSLIIGCAQFVVCLYGFDMVLVVP